MLIKTMLFTVMSVSLLTLKQSTAQESKLQTATFAGGCFWCMEPAFEKLDGVLSVISGYTGGTGKDPTYKDYAEKGHIEVVQVTYDPGKISYERLLETLWHNIDPTDAFGQFVDRGPQYRSAIFYHDEEQRLAAEKSKVELQKSGKFKEQVATEILKASVFYPAEEYHQNYSTKNTLQYEFYRFNSGREQFICRTWGKDKKVERCPAADTEEMTSWQKPSDAELRAKLMPLQYEVTQKEGTEPAFKNEYWNNHRDGIYVDIVSGEPLFSSREKYESGTGWPSFFRPLEPDKIIAKEDRSLFMPRTEVRSKKSGSHLGHVFNDGPSPTGQRYCINSAALRFIPVEDLEKQGYGKYKNIFKPDK